MHDAVLLPARQAVVNVATSPAGWVASETVTSSFAVGVQFSLHTATVNVPEVPRVMPVAGGVTLTHRSGSAGGDDEPDEVGLGLALALVLEPADGLASMAAARAVDEVGAGVLAVGVLAGAELDPVDEGVAVDEGDCERVSDSEGDGVADDDGCDRDADCDEDAGCDVDG